VDSIVFFRIISVIYGSLDLLVIVPLHCVLVTGCVTISRLYHTFYIKSSKFTNNISNTFYIKDSWFLNISLGGLFAAICRWKPALLAFRALAFIVFP